MSAVLDAEPLREVRDALFTVMEPAASESVAPLLLRMRSEDVIVAAQVVLELDRTTPSSVFLYTATPWKSGDAFVDAFLAQIAADRRTANRALNSGDSRAIPALPASCFDPSRSSVLRLLECVRALSERVVAQPGATLVVCLLPRVIEDGVAWGLWLTELLSALGHSSLASAVRWVIRDDAMNSETISVLQAHKPALSAMVQSIVLDANAWARALAHNASNPTTSRESQFASTLTLVALTREDPRNEEILRGLLAYAEESGNPTTQALVLEQYGHWSRAQGRHDEASLSYQAALEAATKGKAYPVLYNATIALGEMGMEARQWNESAIAFEKAAQLARSMQNPWAIGAAWQMQGNALLSANRLQEASDAFRATFRMHVTLGEQHGVETALRSIAMVEEKLGNTSESLKAKQAMLELNGGRE